MSKLFREITPINIKDNVFKLIGSDWMLVTAGTPKSFNTMTAAWGGWGVLWSKNICFCVIRPSRYTYHFMEKADSYTLTFFEEKYRAVLDFCGSQSGRDVDKIAKTGLTPKQSSLGGVYFNEARLVIECRKIYYQDFDPQRFLDDSIHDCYTDKQYHRMYVGEIAKCLLK